MKRLFKSVFLLLYIVGWFAYSPVIAYSVEEISLMEINADKIQSTINEGIIEVSTNVNDNGESEINGNIDTRNLNSGYYTSFIFSTVNDDWRSYDGFAFHMNNNGESFLQLNLNLQSADGTKLSIPDEKIILIKNDDSSIIEKVSLSNGTFKVYGGFDGIIYIPFKSMGIADDYGDAVINNDVDYLNSLESINLWGIPITCRENSEINFKMSRFSLINSGEIKDEYLTDNMKISGNSRIMIPTAGQSIGKYKVSDSQNAVFEMLDNIDYVDISNDGRLTIYDGAEPQHIRICAVDGNICTTKEVELYKSWTEGKTYDDGVSMQILKPEDMRVILSSDNIFLNKTFILFLKIFIILISLAFVGLFLHYRKISKRE